MRGARFLEPAKLELLAEVAYDNAKEPELGQRFLSSVQEVTQGTRRMFLWGFPFAIVYRPDEEGVVIIALAHHSRRPGYWRERAPESSQH